MPSSTSISLVGLLAVAATLTSLLNSAAASSLVIGGTAGYGQIPAGIGGTAGCGRTHTGVGETKHSSIPSSGGNRTFAVHLPGNYDKNKPTGIILSYHGNGKTMSHQETLSRFSEESINPDMIAVYPQGVNNAWEGAPYAAPPTEVSDKAFTTDLLNFMRENYCVDNSHIYASGKSNGGGFVDTLACSPDHGADFAAFAMASAALYTEADGSNCTPARSPLPILEFHGTDDKTIPYIGGTGSEGAQLPAISTWLHSWGIRNGSPQKSTENENGGKVHYTTYTCQGIPNMVQGYKIDGQKHWWPSMQWNTDNKGTVAPIEGSKIMVDFFKMNSKPSAE